MASDNKTLTATRLIAYGVAYYWSRMIGLVCRDFRWQGIKGWDRRRMGALILWLFGVAGQVPGDRRVSFSDVK